METKEFVVTVRRRQFDEIAYRMISENEIDINKFNEEKTALFMILPDEKTTFYRTLFIICKSSIYKARRNGR